MSSLSLRRPRQPQAKPRSDAIEMETKSPSSSSNDGGGGSSTSSGGISSGRNGHGHSPATIMSEINDSSDSDSVPTTDELLDKDRMLVPMELSERFGDMGYVKWTNAYCPVLVIDPIRAVQESLLPSSIYHAWMLQVESLASSSSSTKASSASSSRTSPRSTPSLSRHPRRKSSARGKEQGEEDDSNSKDTTSLPLLVYWYGTEYEVSVVSSLDVIPYEEGASKGYGLVPEFIHRRYKRHLVIPTVYDLLMRSRAQFRIDCKKERQERAISLPWAPPPPPPPKKTAASSSSSSAVPPVTASAAPSTTLANNSLLDQVVLNEWHALAFGQSEDLELKELLLTRRNELLALIPQDIQSMFGKIGFVQPIHKTTKTSSPYVHPVLCVSPFRCPPGPLRTEWFQRYRSIKLELSTSQSSTVPLKSMPLLVYWYGSFLGGNVTEAYTTTIENSTFSFVPWSRWTSYEQGQSFRYHRLPDEICDIFDSKRHAQYKKKVSPCQDWLICGHWEMEQALKIEAPSDRWGGMEDFEEDYEQGLVDLKHYRECLEPEIIPTARTATTRRERGRMNTQAQTRSTRMDGYKRSSHMATRLSSATPTVTTKTTPTTNGHRGRSNRQTKDQANKRTENNTSNVAMEQEADLSYASEVEIIEIDDSSTSSATSPSHATSSSSPSSASEAMENEDEEVEVSEQRSGIAKKAANTGVSSASGRKILGADHSSTKESTTEETASTTDSDLEHDQDVHASILGCAMELLQSSNSASNNKELQNLKQSKEDSWTRNKKGPKKRAPTSANRFQKQSTKAYADNMATTATLTPNQLAASMFSDTTGKVDQSMTIDNRDKQQQRELSSSRAAQTKPSQSAKLLALKKRKERNEEVVRGVIEEWTRKKQRQS